MENDNAEKDRAVVKLTSEEKVLAIGGRRRHYKPKKPVAKFQKETFIADCKNYFSLLLMDSRTPIEPTEDWGMLDLIEKRRIAEKNQPVRLHFYCHRGGSYPYHSYQTYGHTINAEAVLHEVRKRLIDENWKSKYVLELPPKDNKYARSYYTEKEYRVSEIFSEVLNAERIKIFQFLLHLHKQRIKIGENVSTK